MKTNQIQQLTSAIPFSPERVSAAQLAKLWALYDTTSTSYMARRVVRALVLVGVPILSDTKGYYRPTTLKELQDGIQLQERRLRGLAQRINSLKMIAAQWEGQS